MNAFAKLLLCLCCLLVPTLQAGNESDKNAEAVGARTLALRKALEGADRLEVSAGRESPSAPMTISGAEKIASLAKLFTANERLSGNYQEAEPIKGSGDFHLVFYKKGQAIVRLEQYGERVLWWTEGPWKGNTYLSAASTTAWPKWFKENGYEIMDHRYKEWAGSRNLPQKREEAFMKCLPAGAKKHFDAFYKKQEKLMGAGAEISDTTALHTAAKTLLAALGPPHDAGVAICRALGALADPLYADNTIGLNEQAVTAAFAEITSYIMPTVFETALNDPQSATGAARLFFYYEYLEKIPWVMRDGVAPALLRSAVERDQPLNAISAITRSGDISSQRISGTLREIAAGKIAPLTPARLKMRDDEPSLRALATLVLARRGDAETPRLVKELAALPNVSKQDQAAVAICRNFLGERDTIQPVMFDLDSWSIGYYGIAALEQQGDKAALECLITGGTMHSWALVRQDAVHAVQRLTGKIWYRAQPNENEDWYGKDIRDWWATARETWEPVLKR